MDSFGLLSLIPILVILVLSVWTKETFMPIVAGIAVGYLMIEGGHPLKAFNSFLDGLYSVLTDENTVWVLMLVALFGSLIMLMKESGGVMGFSNLAHKVLKTRKASMVGTWVLGIIIFVDDYLNCLAIGAAVRDITDKHKVSREMLAYIINSTGVTDCSFVPISSWAAYMGALMVTAGMTGGLSEFNAYVHTMPFIAYGWIAVICVPLFCLGVIPLFGPMKKAEQRAIETGQTLSDVSKAALVELPEDEKKFEGKKCNVFNFLIPILIVAVLTVTDGGYPHRTFRRCRSMPCHVSSSETDVFQRIFQPPSGRYGRYIPNAGHHHRFLCADRCGIPRWALLTML